MPHFPESTSSSLSVRNSLRHWGLSQREHLSLQDRSIFSHRACSHAAEYLDKKVNNLSGIIFAGYWPIRSEIDPRPLFDFITSRGVIWLYRQLLIIRRWFFAVFRMKVN
ncbi:hypothetical protein [Bartonella sp. 114]|uniref:hypothetical protein n=1 Tax=Bartonella sp. 114 TaxID=1933909 RepID=UPI0009C22545|nr:5-formyltetrahydrofolate cyclo-ligase [Bartonella sp. 114]